MALVGLTGVRRADHVDVGHVGIVGLDVALQLVQKRAVRLIWVGERFRRVCLWHATDYADKAATGIAPRGYPPTAGSPE
jgi:hypothetical protein